MQDQPRRDTGCELRLRSELHRRGLRYRVDARPIPDWRRRADLVFAGARIAVFVDGCFWHGCLAHGSVPKANSAWWESKLERTRDRDRDTDQRLCDAGWTVVRIWEHEDPVAAADRVAGLVARSGQARARYTASSTN
jgi:DNA mismatch endonuclease, patch repair protein